MYANKVIKKLPSKMLFITTALLTNSSFNNSATAATSSAIAANIAANGTIISVVNSPAISVNSERQQELLHLLRQDCGSCHGMTLKGGLGPALLPADLANKPAEFLAVTILQGRPGTAMPPWNAFLSPIEARWLAQQLLDGVSK